MDFSTFYNSLSSEEKSQLASKAATSTDYLYQITTNRRQAGFATIRKLIVADEKITISMFDPNLAA